MSQLGVQVDETFRTFANSWWQSKRLRVDESTRSDYEWRLGYLQRFFDRYRLGEITTRLVDRFRDELHEQAETIRSAQERARTDKGRRPLMETVTDKRGRTYQRRRRPLSNTSINAMIKLLGQILQQAVDYELIPRNPVRVGERSARFLPRVRSNRTFLEIDEFHALLDAASELEAEARADRKGLGRRAMCATLGLAGFRISEMLDLHVATGRLDSQPLQARRRKDRSRHPRGRDDALPPRRAARVRDGPPRARTADGAVGLLLRDRDAANAATRTASATESSTGHSSARTRTARGHGLPALPEITPHSMRRTWATFAASVGRDPKWIASQIGHTDPQFTFSVYQQVATRRYIDEQAIWTVMRFADEPAERVPSRQLTRLATDDPRGRASIRERRVRPAARRPRRGHQQRTNRRLRARARQ